MRRAPTQAEAALWAALRHDQLGMRFRRQFVVGRFVVDLYSPRRRLAVEVDGGVHVDRSEYDAARDRCLRALGVRVLRVRNEDVLERLDLVLSAIRDAARA